MESLEKPLPEKVVKKILKAQGKGLKQNLLPTKKNYERLNAMLETGTCSRETYSEIFQIGHRWVDDMGRQPENVSLTMWNNLLARAEKMYHGRELDGKPVKMAEKD